MATASGLAAKRGQQNVDASILPAVCISFGTNGIAMPIHSISVRNLSANKPTKFVVSKTFGNSKPDYLTAVAGDTVWCLLTLHLAPGDYVLEQIEYNGGKNDSFDYSFNFTQPTEGKYVFHVAPDAVNYVGSIEFSALWNPRLIHASANILHDSIIRESLPSSIKVENSAERDKKWVSDQIPGLRNFPSIISQISKEPPVYPSQDGRARAGNPSIAEAHLNAGIGKSKNGDFAGAIADFDQTIALTPKNAFAFVVRAEAKRAQGNLKASTEDTHQAIELEPNIERSLMSSAMWKRANGDLDGAITDYNRAILLFPTDTAAYYNRGLAKQEKGDIEGAFADFNQAIAVYPTNSFAYVGIGTLKYSLGDFAAAQVAYTQGIEAEPWRADYVRFFLTLVLRLQNRSEGPAGLSKAMRGWPAGWTKSVGRFLLGEITEDALFKSAAEGAANTVREHRCEAHYYAGMMRLLRKDSAAAKAYFTQCVETGVFTFHEYRMAHIELARLVSKPKDQ